jgi:hypothetical protein
VGVLSNPQILFPRLYFASINTAYLHIVFPGPFLFSYFIFLPSTPIPL